MRRRIIFVRCTVSPTGLTFSRKTQQLIFFQRKTSLLATIDILNRWLIKVDLFKEKLLNWYYQQVVTVHKPSIGLLRRGLQLGVVSPKSFKRWRWHEVGLPSDPVCHPLPTVVRPGNLTCMSPSTVVSSGRYVTFSGTLSRNFRSCCYSFITIFIPISSTIPDRS